MVIEGMASDRRNLFWTLAHMVLGFLCTLTPFALIVWFYFIFGTNFGKSLKLLTIKKPAFFLMLFSYLISFEVLDRMAKTSPFIPYELGKYFLVLMGILGIVFLGVRSQKGIWMAILITPALFYDFSGQRNQYDIINYLLGPLAVGLGLAFADRFPISKNALNQILKFIFWACLASLTYTYVRTPDFEDIEFTLGANFATTAGHSSNQVSTILGLGMFLAFYSLLNSLNFSGSRIFDGIILIGFAFQGLLSFSRGGMMVGALGMVLLLFLPEVKKVAYGIKHRVKSQRSVFLGIIALVSLYGVFEAANAITGGNLLLRYQGETQGTLLGTKEVTADHYVTGRLGILEKDFALWVKNPLTGVGLGISQYLRDPDGPKIAAHVEVSRLFADHGVLGIIFAFIFFNLPRSNWNLNKNNMQRNILFILLILSVATTFHAAMRTFITPLFMILGSLKIKENQ
jgi:hypothetical protein